MEMTVTIGGQQYRVDLGAPASLAIPLDFAGPQPGFFGAPAACAESFKTQDFVGNTAEGGSCNVAVLHLVPHCNGTHTESAGHIVNDRIPVTDTLIQGLMPARLITVAPQPAAETDDTYRPEKRADDWMVTRGALHDALVES